MNASGTWVLSIKTPMGTQTPRLMLLQDGDVLTGSMNDPGIEPAPIKEGALDGNKLRWKFDAKKPFPMTIVYVLELVGDELKGTAKAGVFPAAPVTGMRG